MSPPLKVWVAGARPRTLPAAVVPVFVGTAAGYWSSGRLLIDPTLPRHASASVTSLDHQVSWLNAFLALVVALAIQIGTNYINDYADGQRGTDEHRAGPVRLVAGGLATVREVKIAAAASFAVAAIAGFVLAARVTWWFIPLGALCFVAGWAYTGGPRPYGYYGFGELFVFVFFGLVATAGSAYVQHAPFLWNYAGGVLAISFNWGFALWAGVPVGLLAAALLAGEQSARHRDGHRGGQADARGAPRADIARAPVLLHVDGRGPRYRRALPLPALGAPRPLRDTPRHPPDPPGLERSERPRPLADAGLDGAPPNCGGGAPHHRVVGVTNQVEEDGSGSTAWSQWPTIRLV